MGQKNSLTARLVHLIGFAATDKQPETIAFKLWHFRLAAGQALQQLAMKCSGSRAKPVVHPQPILSSLNKPRPAQIRQMPRNLRLRPTHDLNDVADAEFVLPLQEIQDSKASWIRKRPKNQVDGAAFSFCQMHLLRRI